MLIVCSVQGDCWTFLSIVVTVLLHLSLAVTNADRVAASRYQQVYSLSGT
jgi:hypothetical protein